jgi:hypothetical protein
MGTGVGLGVEMLSVEVEDGRIVAVTVGGERYVFVGKLVTGSGDWVFPRAQANIAASNTPRNIGSAENRVVKRVFI